MKILMTGMTAAHTKTNGNVRISGAYALLKALQYYGHHKVIVAEPSVHTRPQDYDVIMCGLYVTSAMTSRHKFKLFEFLHRAFNAGTKVVFYVDDWHLSQIFSGLRRNTTAFRGTFAKHTALVKDGGLWFGGDEEERMNVIANEQVIWDTRLRIGCYSELPAGSQLLVQFFPWGDHSKLSKVIKWPASSIIPWNPDAFLSNEASDVKPWEERERAWVVSTPYQQFDQWVQRQQLEWPVINTGRKGGYKERTEPDLFKNVYARYTGVVSHPYPANLIGMWRNRFLFGLSAGAVIYADPREVSELDVSFDQALIKRRQSASDQALYELAYEQRYSFLQKQKPLEYELAKIEGTLV